MTEQHEPSADDVEGHKIPRADDAGTDDDVEGHKIPRADNDDTDDDVQGHKKMR